MGIEAFIRFYSFIKKTSIYNDYDLSVLRAKTIAPCYSIVVIRYKLFWLCLRKILIDIVRPAEVW